MAATEAVREAMGTSGLPFELDQVLADLEPISAALDAAGSRYSRYS